MNTEQKDAEFFIKANRFYANLDKQPAAPAQAQHSPLPWSYSGIDDCVMAKINGQRVVVAQIIDGLCVENQDAAFIVRACNNAQRLADALAKAKQDLIDIKADCDTGEFEIDPQFAIDRISEALAEWSKHNE